MRIASQFGRVRPIRTWIRIVYVMDAHSRYFKINIDVSSVVSDRATNDANWQEPSQSLNYLSLLMQWRCLATKFANS